MVREQFSLLEKTVKGVKSFARSSILTLAMGFAAIGCSGPNGSQGTVPMNGIAADGPFQADSEVFINKLDNDLNGTSETTYARTDALGRYNTELGKHSCFLSTVTGKDFNEITGQGSATDISISSFYCTTSSTADKTENDVTQMVLERQKALYLDGAGFDEASAQARDELFSQLDFIVGTPDCLPYEMNIITGSSTCNDPLLAVEIVVRNYAVNEAEQSGNTVEYELHDMMSSIMFDLADDGTLSQDIKDKLNRSAMNVDVANATANLQQYLDTHGGTAKAPNADNVLDSDLDGIVNAEDCLPHDPLRWTGHADVDADGHDAIACGGDDCDDDCDTCYPGADELCGEARDHDCDGLVDELNGCGAGDCVVGVPSVVGSVFLGGDGHDIFVKGDTVFVAADDYLLAYDASDSSNMVQIAKLDLPYLCTIIGRGDTLFAFNVGGEVYSIKNFLPDSLNIQAGPFLTGTSEISGAAISSAENLIYVSSPEGLSVLGLDSLTTIAGPVEQFSSDWATNIFVRNGTAYLSDLSGLFVMEYNGTSIDMLAGPVKTGASIDVYVSDNNNAFIASVDGLYVVDVSNLDSPSLIAGPIFENLVGVFPAGEQLLVLTNNDLKFLDISNPSMPVETATIVLSSEYRNEAVFVTDSHAFVIAEQTLYSIDLDCSD